MVSRNGKVHYSVGLFFFFFFFFFFLLLLGLVVWLRLGDLFVFQNSKDYYYYYYYFTRLRVFHTIVDWWSSTGIWVIASLLTSLGLISVFWSILIMLSFGWFLLVFLFPILPISLPILWWLNRARQLQLVIPSLLCSIVFFRSLARFWYLSVFLLSFNFIL